MSTDEAKKETPEEKVESLESEYEFEVELANGTKEVLTIPRVTVRMSAKIAFSVESKGFISPEGMAMELLELLVPDVLDRTGGKAPIISSISALGAKIIEMDGETLFGKNFRKKLKVAMEEKPPKKNRAARRAKKPKPA